MTDAAARQWHSLTARDQSNLEVAVKSRLEHEPRKLSKAVKELRPNSFAKYELRAGDLRVLYDVEEEVVVIGAIGKKVGNKLIVEGREFNEHQNDPPEPSGGKAGTDTP